MAFYYARTDATRGTGTATGNGGRSATILTGDWNAAMAATTSYYASRNAALAADTPPVAGDIIILSNIHNHNYGATTVQTCANGVITISVDDTAIDEELAGAIDQAIGGTYDLSLFVSGASGEQYHRGVSYIAGDDILLNGSSESSFYLKNGLLKNAGSASSDAMASLFDGSRVILTDTDVHLTDNSSMTLGIRVTNGNEWIIDGGSLLFTTNKPNQIFNVGGAGGGRIVMNGFDASNLTTSGALCEVESSSDDNVLAIFKNVLKPASSTLNTVAVPKPGQRFEAYSCGSANEYYNFEVDDNPGAVIADTGIYRDGFGTYDGTNKYSYKVTPIAANCIKGVIGIQFPILSRYLDLTTSKTVRVYLVINNTVSTATTLDHLDVLTRVKYSDNTNEVLGVIAESAGGSILKSGTALTASAEAWTGDHATNAKQYQIDVVIPSLANVDNGLVQVELMVSADSLGANDQIYVCPDWDAV